MIDGIYAEKTYLKLLNLVSVVGNDGYDDGGWVGVGVPLILTK